MDWTTDKALVDMLVKHEGCELKLYKCTAGKLTIGVGHNIEDNGITADVAFYILRGDIKAVLTDLDRSFPWWRQMTENRQRVLIDMCFNMGIKTLSTFKNTLAAMEQGSYLSASNGMLKSKWASQVGQRAHRLAQMMRNG